MRMRSGYSVKIHLNDVHAVACVVCADSVLLWTSTEASSALVLLIKVFSMFWYPIIIRKDLLPCYHAQECGFDIYSVVVGRQKVGVVSVNDVLKLIEMGNNCRYMYVHDVQMYLPPPFLFSLLLPPPLLSPISINVSPLTGHLVLYISQSEFLTLLCSVLVHCKKMVSTLR